jgi:hypothetical protein
MAILAIVTGDGFSKQMYEQLRKDVDWEHKHPTGVIFHAASFDNTGNNIRVERLNAPIPKAEIFTLHNVNAYQGTDTYRVK